MSKAGAGEFVTMQVLKEMLAMQDRAYRSSIQILVEDIKSEVKELKKDISELKESASFTSSKYEEMKAKMGKVDVDIKAIYHQIDGLNNDYNYSFEELEVKQEYLENQSRRNNVKIVGVKESDDEKTWDDTEKVVKNLIKTKLGITEEVVIERAHRVGRKIKNRAHNRHVGSASASGDDSSASPNQRETMPRPIVAKIQSWKTKERIIREARIKRPKGVQFLNDFSKRTLERRASHIPEMLEAREQGKVAYMIMDRLIIRDKLPGRDKDVVNIEDEVFVSQRQRK